MLAVGDYVTGNLKAELYDRTSETWSTVADYPFSGWSYTAVHCIEL